MKMKMIFDGINWDSVEQQIYEFGAKPPFDHVVIDNFFKDDFAQKLFKEFPAYEADTWHGYDNPIEVKKACNDWNLFPPITYSVFSYFNSQDWLDFLSSKSEFQGLKYISSAITSNFISPPSFNIVNLGISILQLPSLFILPLNTKLSVAIAL